MRLPLRFAHATRPAVPADTCCRAMQHDLPDHRSESGRSLIVRVGNIAIQHDPPEHKLDSGGSFRIHGRRRGHGAMRSAELGDGECVDGRLSALTRRYADLFRGNVNSAPAKCCAWPVAVPAGAFVRAGAGRRGVGGAIAARCVRFTSAVRFCWDVLRWFASVDTFLLICFAFGSRLSLFLCQEKRDGLQCVAFLFRRGSGSP